MKVDGATPADGRDPDPTQTLDVLLPLQRELWEKGDRPRVEALLEQHPALRQHKDAVLDLINHEIVLRAEFETPATKEEYFQRFPEYRADLELLFEVQKAFDDVGEGEGETHKTDSPGHSLASPFPRLPHYALQEVLGEGGMGIVYKATDERLKRTVAVKMIRAGSGLADRKRFQSEAEAVAKLHHPHIVQIFEVGECLAEGASTPLPYFALEFLDGGSLTQLLHGEPQPALLAASLVEILARAVHYAHGQGIIHRDLKPQNVLLQKAKMADGASTPAGLVVKEGAAYLPKVADFGLAKHVQPDSQASQTQAIVGTPSYMAPEQAGDFSKKIGPAADIYALGAILYEAIVGRPPFRGASVLETLDQVRGMDPVAPCRLQPRCPRDLETICLKCLKKDPAARFASAADLADDLGRFLRHEPIRARRTSAWEHGRLWCRRNPRVALLSGSLLAVIVLSLLTVTWLWQRAARGEASAYAHLYASQINLGQRYWQEVQCDRMSRLLEALRQPPAGQRDLRDFEWYYLWGLLHRDIRQMTGDQAVAWSPDGKLLATAGTDRSLRLWLADARAAGAPFLQWQAHADPVTSLAFGPRGELLLSGSMDRTARLWRASDGSLVKMLDGHSSEITSVAIDRATGALATACRDGSIRLWEADGTLRLILEEHKGPVNQVAFSPEGKLLVSGGEDAKVRVWDVSTGEVVHLLEGHADVVLTVAFAPDGQSVVSGGRDRIVRQWDVARGEQLYAFPELPHWVQRVAFRSDGKKLAAACWDRTIHLWDVGPAPKKTAAETPVILRQFDRVVDLAFHPTERWLASVGKDHAVRLWDSSLDPEARTVQLPGLCSGFALHPRERLLACGLQQSVCLCNLESGECVTLPRHGDWVTALAFSADGQWLASASRDGTIRCCRMPGGATVHEWKSNEVGALAFHPRTHELASGARDGVVRFWDPKTGTEVGRAESHQGPVLCLAFSADGQSLFSGGADQWLRVWNAAQPGVALAARQFDHAVLGLAVSAEGERVAVAGRPAAISVWDWQRDQLLHTLEGQAGYALPLLEGQGRSAEYFQKVAFSQSGRRLVTGGADGNVKLWDLTTGQELLTLRACDRALVGVVFDRTDETLIAVGNGVFNGQVRIWDAAPGKVVEAPNPKR